MKIVFEEDIRRSLSCSPARALHLDGDRPLTLPTGCRLPSEDSTGHTDSHHKLYSHRNWMTADTSSFARYGEGRRRVHAISSAQLMLSHPSSAE